MFHNNKKNDLNMELLIINTSLTWNRLDFWFQGRIESSCVWSIHLCTGWIVFLACPTFLSLWNLRRSDWEKQKTHHDNTKKWLKVLACHLCAIWWDQAWLAATFEAWLLSFWYHETRLLLTTAVVSLMLQNAQKRVETTGSKCFQAISSLLWDPYTE